MDARSEHLTEEASDAEPRTGDEGRRLLLKRLARGAYAAPVALALMTTQAHAS